MDEPVVAAETYARWRATTLGGITERVETQLVFELAGPLQGKRVLDVGTGDGAYALEAAARGALVTALDDDAQMLAAAAARAAQRGLTLERVKGQAQTLPFADASFDVVFAVTVLCFMPDPKLAVREMVRVLVPGGCVVLGELGRFSVWAAERRLRAWLGASTWRHARFRSRAELAALAHDAGLRVLDVRGAVFFPPNAFAARALAPVEPLLTRLRAPGGAFLALVADKPEPVAH
jgi:2-polyprenyl-3-methyl-5-hydroxy-6-metoxy-1,4-benzoquinol methylase